MNSTTRLRRMDRRYFSGGLGALIAGAATGCATRPEIVRRETRVSRIDRRSAEQARYRRIYGPLPYEQFPIPAVDLDRVPARFYRRRVPDPTGEKPGTIVVDTPNFHLYLVEPDGMAIRYGVGLGRAGFEWSGRANVGWKQKWPTWTPPQSMIEREPELAKWSADNGGMPPGLDNPLGSRAIYIFKDGKDTLYRIHGTPEIGSIGRAVSSGCVRMINQDVIHLYTLVEEGAPIVVY